MITYGKNISTHLLNMSFQLFEPISRYSLSQIIFKYLKKLNSFNFLV